MEGHPTAQRMAPRRCNVEGRFEEGTRRRVPPRVRSSPSSAAAAAASPQYSRRITRKSSKDETFRETDSDSYRDRDDQASLPRFSGWLNGRGSIENLSPGPLRRSRRIQHFRRGASRRFAGMNRQHKHQEELLNAFLEGALSMAAVAAAAAAAAAASASPKEIPKLNETEPDEIPAVDSLLSELLHTSDSEKEGNFPREEKKDEKAPQRLMQEAEMIPHADSGLSDWLDGALESNQEELTPQLSDHQKHQKQQRSLSGPRPDEKGGEQGSVGLLHNSMPQDASTASLSSLKGLDDGSSSASAKEKEKQHTNDDIHPCKLSKGEPKPNSGNSDATSVMSDWLEDALKSFDYSSGSPNAETEARATAPLPQASSLQKETIHDDIIPKEREHNDIYNTMALANESFCCSTLSSSSFSPRAGENNEEDEISSLSDDEDSSPFFEAPHERYHARRNENICIVTDDEDGNNPFQEAPHERYHSRRQDVLGIRDIAPTPPTPTPVPTPRHKKNIMNHARPQQKQYRHKEQPQRRSSTGVGVVPNNREKENGISRMTTAVALTTRTSFTARASTPKIQTNKKHKETTTGATVTQTKEMQHQRTSTTNPKKHENNGIFSWGTRPSAPRRHPAAGAGGTAAGVSSSSKTSQVVATKESTTIPRLAARQSPPSARNSPALVPPSPRKSPALVPPPAAPIPKRPLTVPRGPTLHTSTRLEARERRLGESHTLPPPRLPPRVRSTKPLTRPKSPTFRLNARFGRKGSGIGAARRPQGPDEEYTYGPIRAVATM